MKEKGRIRRMISLGMQQLSDPYYQGMAPQIAFYFLLSLVPMAILISQLFGMIMGTSINEAVGWIFDDAKGDVAKAIKSMFTFKSGGFSNLVYIVIAIWGASRAQFSMMRINNYINTEGWSTGKGYFHERIRSMGNILLTMIAITAALVFMSYGGKVIELLTDNPNLWLYLRWPIALLMFFMIISVYYYALPEKKVRIREIIPGSIFASVGLLAVTFVYSIYTSSIANYDIIYGSLATVVALMFWFFFLAWVFCLGMIFNKVWKDTKKK